jgi:rhodanese-related sulfurtransferase
MSARPGHTSTARATSSSSRLSEQAATIARDRPVVFYCRVGSRSDMAAKAFGAAGFRAHSMRDGLLRWAKEGRPLVPADGYVADH